MGGCSEDVAAECQYYGNINIVLVGSTGNGKSATGNSILGRKEFVSKCSFRGVTNTCERGETVLQEGKIINVIDTPGLFDSSSSLETVTTEIARCVEMAKDGIHAVVMVLSLKARFSEEQVAAVDTLKHLFGERIIDYMIVVFTGGDFLEENFSTFDELLASSSTKFLNEQLEKCGRRMVVFDNKTKDEDKKAEQLHNLVSLIRKTVERNGGQPFYPELCLEFKEFDAGKDSYNSEQIRQRIALFVNEKLLDHDKEIISKLMNELESLKNQREEDLRDKNQREEHLRDKISRLEGELEQAKAECEKKWGCSVM